MAILLSKDHVAIGNRTRDLPTCMAVPQPTALRRAPKTEVKGTENLIGWCTNHTLILTTLNPKIPLRVVTAKN